MRTTSIPVRLLGSTGLNVSALGFGGAVIGIEGYLKRPGEQAVIAADVARATVEMARERGVNFFDTAPGYGGGRSEEIIGQALAPYRDSVHIATKVGVHPGEHPETWTASVMRSLERLRTDHVDLLQLHGNTWTDELADWVLAEPLTWLETMRRQGLARWIGLTAEAPSGGLERLLRTRRFHVLQMAYSVIYQCACDYQRVPFGVIPLAKELGMGVLTMRTTTSGVLHNLLRAEFPELSGERVSRMAIKFVLSTPEVDCALVGMGNPGEADANCALAADPTNRFDLVALHDFFPARTAQTQPLSTRREQS
jgi:aryl-alcohol dehydrogenase-like predicted oxidoreductase